MGEKGGRLYSGPLQWLLHLRPCHFKVKALGSSRFKNTFNEIISFSGKWMELETIVLSRIARLRQTHITCFQDLIYGI